MIVERVYTCKFCGGRIDLPEDAATLICKCGTEYEYCPEKRIVPELIFQRRGRSPFEYPVRGDIIIGRRPGKGYVWIRSVEVDSIKENTYIRNPYISGIHCKITVEDQYKVREKSGRKEVVIIPKCRIENVKTSSRTTVNGVQLKPYEARELKSNDKVELAAGSNIPLIFHYREKM